MASTVETASRGAAADFDMLRSGVGMGPIVIIGRHEDLCCQLVRQRLTEAGRESLFLPEDRLFPHFDFAWRVAGADGCGALSYDGRETNFRDVGGVLARFYSIPVSADEFATKDGRYISAEWNALVMAWLPRLRCPVVNRLRPELWYKSHLNVTTLLSLVLSIKFKLPRVMVTSNIEDARRFYRSSGGRMRYVPLTQPSSFRITGEESLEKLAALSGTLPFQLVEAVEGVRAEAFVVGDRVVLAIEDGSLNHEHAAEVTDHCLEVAEALGLAFCSLSLVRARRGDWYCMGAERMPQVFQLGEEARAEVTEGLVALLTAGERRGRA